MVEVKAVLEVKRSAFNSFLIEALHKGHDHWALDYELSLWAEGKYLSNNP
jgi:hypothetical protein